PIVLVTTAMTRLYRPSLRLRAEPCVGDCGNEEPFERGANHIACFNIEGVIANWLMVGISESNDSVVARTAVEVDCMDVQIRIL
ncbi:hypothetical protein MK280_04825, partial [Myxococcota bacterium]|nr:hypothetical protein [Myxococcota bacterium]